MKKVTFTAIAVACALQGWCLAPGATTRIEGPGTGVYHPVLSPDGSSLLYSSIEHTGLKAYNMNTGDITLIDDAPAAGFAPIFSADGSKVFYRTAGMVDGLLCHDVRAYDIAGKSSDIIAPMTRRSIDLNAAATKPTYAFANYQTITV